MKSDGLHLTEPQHVPVLPGAVLQYIDAAEGVVVDCTLGLGGHARLLLEQRPRLRLVGLDVDPANLHIAQDRLSEFGDRLILRQANFAELGRVLDELRIGRVQGVLADLGVSSSQLDDAGRGLSFERDAPLDMRLDPRLTVTAADLVNTLPERELADLLFVQSEERHSRRIARRICEARRQGRIGGTLQLARLVASACGVNPDSRKGRIHPATRTFMALRMAVNRELDRLAELLEQIPRCLSVGGRAAVISFHSGEDRLVKRSFQQLGREGVYKVLTKSPVIADEDETARNPRSRSAKLRAAERMHHRGTEDTEKA